MKQKLQHFFQGRYGMDPLGKAMFICSLVLYFLGLLLRNNYFGSVLATLAMMVLVFQMYRMFSRQSMLRQEENRKYEAYVKLWKLRRESRKTHKIYICKGCGRYVRVPKGKGKIEVTCRVCGCRKIHRT